MENERVIASRGWDSPRSEGASLGHIVRERPSAPLRGENASHWIASPLRGSQ
ncbi:MAG: hypothetical protein LBT00_00660 [Spirochaetaceae bacterium]|nr:hypothetical protein [Spirochaetaceae bacterium]